jgi:hypothetical protein
MSNAFAVGPPVTDFTYSALESKPGDTAAIAADLVGASIPANRRYRRVWERTKLSIGTK